MRVADDAQRLLQPEPPTADLDGLEPEIQAGTPSPAPEPAELLDTEPGRGDLEAAVALVCDGLANRIVLTGFPSWPGLLWHAYQLAAEYDVRILPTIVHEGGRLDIVITRETAANG